MGMGVRWQYQTIHFREQSLVIVSVWYHVELLELQLWVIRPQICRYGYMSLMLTVIT